MLHHFGGVDNKVENRHFRVSNSETCSSKNVNDLSENPIAEPCSVSPCRSDRNPMHNCLLWFDVEVKTRLGVAWPQISKKRWITWDLPSGFPVSKFVHISPFKAAVTSNFECIYGRAPKLPPVHCQCMPCPPLPVDRRTLLYLSPAGPCGHQCLSADQYFHSRVIGLLELKVVFYVYVVPERCEKLM